MKIDAIKINGFGKIKNKEIELKDGINIIYGENESGKSTILKFIESILYGIAKNKNGKDIPDFDRYKPWDNSEFSGKIKYTLDNNEQYEVFRDFKKKSPIIYKANEDISKEFAIDKAKGIRFLEEQIGIDETSFCNTVMMRQQEVKLGKTDTDAMVQRISNLVSSGDDTISFKKSMDKLNKLQNERIGTERTRQKPINVVISNLNKLEEQKQKLKECQENSVHQETEKEQIKAKITELQEKKQRLKESKQVVNDDKIKNIEMQLKMKSGIGMMLVLILILVLLLVIVQNKLFAIIPAIILGLNIFAILKIRQNTRMGNSNFDISKIEKEIEKIEEEISHLQFKNHILDSEKANLDEKLEQLARIEEEIEEQNCIKEELVSLNVSFEIAKECLQNAYDEMKHHLSPKFEQKLCEITSSLTNEKYKNVVVNDEKGLYIEVENGTYMPVDRLSIGTIDEMYLALRLSILAEISKEKLPIFLDETFAFFDENRLKNILCYLQDQNYDYQILIFTCSNREEQVLNQLKIEYHLINLEN